MKSKITLRSLISLSFLLFFLPFLRTCSDRSIQNLHSDEVTTVLIADSAKTVITGSDTIRAFTEPSKQEEITLLKKEKEDKISAIQETKKQFTFNFYSLLINTFTDKSIDSETLKDQSFYPFLTYLVVLISAVVMLVLAFLNKIKAVKILSLINLILLISSTILLYFCQVLEAINQIKVGFYLIFINFVLIMIVSGKVLKNNQTV